MSASDFPLTRSSPHHPITSLEARLKAALEGEVRFDRVSRALYATDASVYQIMPLGVVIPRSREDVLRTVQLCREHGVSITARGGGTSQAGQAVGAGIQLDGSKYLNRLLELNAAAAWVRVEPGLVLDELNAQLQPHGVHLPLDISTSDRATIGGMIANNSAGTRSVIYGKTLDYVLELTVVLADGSVVELCPLAEEELAAKCAQDDREGACYRIVRQLSAEHAAEIERRFPRILRRVGGYNLDEFVERGTGGPPFNLSRLIVGSEGTLALILAAKLRVVPLPQARALAVVQFDDLLESLAATPRILRHGPAAVELLDRFVLDSTRGKIAFEPLRDFIAGDPAACLIVEFFADDAGTLPARLDALAADLQAHRLGYHFHRAIEPAAQARIWKLRRAALGLSMSERGDAKAISFVEDTAVAPDRLRDYIERFQQILAAHDTHAGFYAHASVGLLHVRPVVNLKTVDGVEKFQRIAAAVADLVLEFGGALSGEHGDGLVRAPFQEKMFGSVLYQAFCQVKQTFDPTGLFNPGKIVHAPPLTANLRFGPAYPAAEARELPPAGGDSPAGRQGVEPHSPYPLAFDFADFGGLLGAAEQCGGIGECRKQRAGTMCPSYRATRDEVDSTRGRANALRLAISGQLGPEGLTDPALYRVLDLCLECKACKTECPTGVDMARMKSEFLHQYHRAHGAPLRARLLAHTERLAFWGSRFPSLSNRILGSPATRWLADRLLGLDRCRTLPALAPAPFQAEFTGSPALHDSADAPLGPIALFPDTWMNYFEPEIGIAAAELVRAAGGEVVVAPRVCCGRPLISKGFLEAARCQAEATVRALSPLAQAGTPILFCEPSCYSAVRDDHPHLLRGELQQQARTVAESCVTFEEWAAGALAAGGRHAVRGVGCEGADVPRTACRALFRAGPRQLLLHTHCHQRALVGSGPAVRLLAAIPHCRVTDLDSGCCGMAGSFGYEREHYEISRQVGEQRLLPAVRAQAPGTAIVAAGFSCRQQIRHFTGAAAVHPAVLLRSLLGRPWG
jgi:FAD/FMN-containing dehydrogenase/Fe-S oxidoreductase